MRTTILAVVLALIVVGVGIGYYFHVQSSSSSNNTDVESSTPNPSEQTPAASKDPSAPLVLRGKKILHIDSYHKGYEWSDGICRGVRSGLKDSGARLEILYLDTKRNTSEEFKKAAGKNAKVFIETYRPDVIIAADDNASKYVIQPYFKDADIPVVFCGVNWDAAVYGYPYKNSTGMVEVEPIEPLTQQMKKYAKGNRIGFVGNKVYTAEKVAKTYNDLFFQGKMKIYLASTFEEFKTLFLQAQNEVDMLILYNYAGIKNWNSEEAEAFLLKNTRIPTGSTLDFMAPYVLFAFARIPEEQGEWAAEAAKKILAGTKPSDIPETTNRRFQLMINMKLAKKLGITFDSATLDMAEILR